MIEILALAGGLILACAEFYLWHARLLWHTEAKEDRRNFRPM
jgi:hypothetical protein